MLEVKKIRDLIVAKSADEGTGFVSAASGLAVAGDNIYIVADDRLCLASFNLNDTSAGKWIRLFPGTLPQEHKERKAKKPDLEAICVLPPSKFAAHGALLVVPSGSKEWRFNACILPLNLSGGIAAEPLPLNFSKLFTHLRTKVQKLNIEGACVHGEKLFLANRGNSHGEGNAIIALELGKFLYQAYDIHEIASEPYLSINHLELGRVKKVALAFTDFCALSDGRFVFSAAAECTDDAYEDGACAGSAVGLIDAKLETLTLSLLDTTQKVEGVYAKPTRSGENQNFKGSLRELILVTDADSETSVASMLSTAITL